MAEALVRTLPLDTDDLQAAFSLFNQVSEQLEQAYTELEGQVETLNAQLVDVRAEREAQRREKELLAARMEGLLEELPVGVVLVGDHGLVEEANHAARRLLEGLDAGVDWEETVARNLRGSVNSGDMLLGFGRRITLTRREISSTSFVVVLTDVTRLHELQENVERSRRLSEMGEMAARLAHQIRTPVSAAMLYASNLDASSSAYVRRCAGKILDRLRHLEAMVTDTLLFARGGGGDLEYLSAEEIITSACELAEKHVSEIVSLDGEEKLDADSSCARVFGNRELVVGAIVNLMTNSAQLGATEIIIEKRVSCEGYLELSVRDDGPGIDPSLADKLFEPFCSSRSGGTGLGLAVVRAAAESFGGVVNASNNAGGGATFCMRLPIQQEAPTIYGTSA